MNKIDRFCRSKWGMISITFVFVIILMCSCYYIMISRANKAAIASVNESREKSVVDLQALNARLSSKADIKTKKAAIEVYATSIKDLENKICPQRGAFYYSALPSKDKCIEKQQKLHNVQLAVTELSQYFKDEAIIAAFIKPISKTDASFTDQQSYWSEMSTKISKLKLSSKSASLQNALKTASFNYSNSWKALDEANNAKNKAAFTTAQQQLQTNYDTLIAVQKLDNSLANELVAKIKASYSIYLQN
jgi:hypothetical protein